MKNLPEDKQEALFKRIKKIRDIAKNGNYASQYLAGVSRLSITCGISMEAAKTLHTAYWDKNWAWKEISASQKTKECGNMLWLQNPVNKFWYALRNDRDIGSTLVQGTASYVFDLWVKNVLSTRDQLTGQFHDEIIIEVKKGHRQDAEDLILKAMEKTNNELELNRKLSVGIQFGDNYGQIH